MDKDTALRLTRLSLILLAALFSTCANASAAMSSPKAEPVCSMRESDKAWLDHAVEAWRYTARTFGPFNVPEHARVIIASAECVLVSDTALFSMRRIEWVARDGKGKIPIAEDFSMPLSPTSQAMTVNGNPYFIMSAPSVWRKAGVSGGSIGLENLMTAVFIHETSHILQQKSYFPMVDALIKTNNLPDSFNDDAIQDRFKSNQVFSASVKQETELLFAAADATTNAEARKLAGQAFDLIKSRRSRYYADAKYMGELEDIFLTLEGSGQWLGYRWLIDLRGGNMAEIDARTRFGKGGSFWSQEQGLALFMVIDRLDVGKWKRSAFGDGGRAGIAFLEIALGHNHAGRR